MGSEVNPLDGLDAEPWNTRRCVLDAWLFDWPAGIRDRFDDSGHRKIGNRIEPAQARDGQNPHLLRDVKE